MKIKRTFAYLFSLFFVLFSQSALAWSAGFDQQPLPGLTHISKNDKAACLAGYGLLCWREATGVHDQVLVQSLFLSDKSTSDGKASVDKANNDALLFISLDAIGFSQDLARKIRESISRAIMLQEERIVLTAIHTHSSIDLQGLWGSVPKNQKIDIVDAVTLSAKNAYEKAQNASLHLSVSDGLEGYNRRTKNNDIIPKILTLQLRNEKNSPIVTLFTLGSHPVVLDESNTKISADWVHYARESLIEQLHAPGMFINGVLGDVLPAHGNPRTFAFAKAYGSGIAENIISSLQNSKPLHSSLKYCTETIDDTSDNDKLTIMTKLLMNGTVEWFFPFRRSYRTRTSVIMLDDLVLMTTPGEPITSMGKQLVQHVPDHPVAVLGLTHDSLGYLIPDKDIRKDTYEENMMVSRTLTGKVTRSLKKLLKECLIPEQT